MSSILLRVFVEEPRKAPIPKNGKVFGTVSIRTEAWVLNRNELWQAQNPKSFTEEEARELAKFWREADWRTELVFTDDKGVPRRILEIYE